MPRLLWKRSWQTETIYACSRSARHLSPHRIVVDPPVAMPGLVQANRALAEQRTPQSELMTIPSPWAPEGIASIDALSTTTEALYPNVQDLIEIVLACGIAIDFPPNFPFDTLTCFSHLLISHPRAILLHPGEYYEAVRHDLLTYGCPKEIPEHDLSWQMSWSQQDPMCAKLWLQDVRGGSPITRSNRMVVRQHHGCVYVGMSAPPGANQDAREGIVLRAPLTHFEIMAGQPEFSEYAKELTDSSGIPVEEVFP